MEGVLTVIVTSTYKPHPGKARLVLSNMKENVEAFGAMGMTCRISRVIFGPDTGSLVFSFFSEKNLKKYLKFQNFNLQLLLKL